MAKTSTVPLDLARAAPALLAPSIQTDAASGELAALLDRRELAAALFDRHALARFLDVSVLTLDRLDSTGRLPQAIRLGVRQSLKRWRRSEIDAWLAAGCPDRKTWEALQQEGVE